MRIAGNMSRSGEYHHLRLVARPSDGLMGKAFSSGQGVAMVNGSPRRQFGEKRIVLVKSARVNAT